MKTRGTNTYTLVVGVHGAPAALALLLNGTLGRIRAQVVGDDRTSGLHVQEVRRQGTLRSVGVVGALLALLLLVGSRGDSDGDRGQDRADSRQQASIEADELADAVHAGSLTQQEVCLAEVLAGEALQKLLDGRQTSVDL